MPRRRLRYEHRSEPLLPRNRFALRLLRNAAAAGGLIAASLAIGVLGFHWTDRLAWLDSLVAASMLLSGMGPISAPQTDAAKWFVSAYALFSGIVFLTVAAVLIAPVLHRTIHQFHLELDERE